MKRYYIFLIIYSLTSSMFAQSSYQQLESNYVKGDPDSKMLNAFSTQTEQILRDFVNVLTLLHDKAMDLGLREVIRERCIKECLETATIHWVEDGEPLLVKDYLNRIVGKSLFKTVFVHDEIVIERFKKKSDGVYRAMLETTVRRSKRRETISFKTQFEYELVKVVKKFGEEVLEVWEPKISAIRLYQNP